MLFIASATAADAETLVRHAGEWETTIDNGQPRIVCFTNDVTMDQNSIVQSMSKLPGASCTVSGCTTSNVAAIWTKRIRHWFATATRWSYS